MRNGVARLPHGARGVVKKGLVRREGVARNRGPWVAPGNAGRDISERGAGRFAQMSEMSLATVSSARIVNSGSAPWLSVQGEPGASGVDDRCLVPCAPLSRRCSSSRSLRRFSSPHLLQSRP